MIKTDKFNIPTTWNDLSVTQAQRLVEWSKKDGEDKIKLLSILLNVSEQTAANIRASDGEAVLASVMQTLKDEIEMPDVPKKLLGYSTDININKLTMRQMMHMDAVIKELKTEGMLNLCSKIVAVCMCSGTDEEIDKLIVQLDEQPVTLVKQTADFFLTKYSVGLTLQTDQLLQKSQQQSKSGLAFATLKNMVSLIWSGRLQAETPQRMSK
jgi:hypothetical protein